MAKTSSQNTNTAPLTEQLQNPPKIITGTTDQASQSPSNEQLTMDQGAVVNVDEKIINII